MKYGVWAYLHADWFAQLLGWVGLAFALASTQATQKRDLLLCDIACCVFKILHFFLLGAPGGAVAQSLFLVMCLLGLLVDTHRKYRPLFYLIYPLLLVASWHEVSTSGAVELLPQAQVLMAAIARQLHDMLAIRVVILASNVPAFLYGVIEGSHAFMASTLIFMGFSSVAVRNQWAKKSDAEGFAGLISCVSESQKRSSSWRYSSVV